MDLIERLKHIRRAVDEFADIDYQRRVWLNGEGPEVSSAEEAYSDIFDAFDLPQLLTTGEFPEDSRRKLEDFLKAIDQLQTEELQDATLLLRNPSMVEVQRLATDAREAIDERLTSESL